MQRAARGQTSAAENRSGGLRCRVSAMGTPQNNLRDSRCEGESELGMIYAILRTTRAEAAMYATLALGLVGACAVNAMLLVTRLPS